MKKILLPIITLLLIGLTLVSCDLFGDNDSDVKRLLFIDVTPKKSVFTNGDNIKDNITVKSFYSDGSDKTLQNEEYHTNLLGDKVTSSTSVEISYTEGGITKTKDIQIYLGDKTLSDIEVITKTDFFSIDDDIKDYIIVQSVYTDGTKSIVSKGRYTVSPTNIVTSSLNNVEIIYEEGSVKKSKDLQIILGTDKTLDRIEVITKTDIFIEGHNIKDYIIVQSVYSDGTVKNVLRDDYRVSPTDIVTSPTTLVTISYTEESITKEMVLPITIGNRRNLISIDVTLNKSVFYEGDNIKDHLKVQSYYSDGSDETLPKESYSTDLTDDDKVTSKTDEVTITYSEGGVTKTKTTSITNKTLIDIEVTTNTDTFIEGKNIRNYLTVQSVHSDGTKVLLSKGDYTVSPTDIIYSTNTSVEIFYTESGITKSKDVSFTVVSSKTLISLDVTLSPTNYVFSEGDNVKEHLIVKGYYSDSSETTITDTDYSTDITTVTSKTNEVTVTYTENSITKSKTIPISVRSSGSGITLNDIEVITNTDILYDGDDIKDHLTVKGLYTNGFERTLSKDDYSTNLLNDRVTTNTDSVTVTYTDGVTKTKTISIKVFSDIEVITETEDFFEGENIKDFITVKSVYSDGSKKTLSETDYNISPSEIVYSTNTSLEISYTENGVTKTKSINITLGNLSDYEIDNSWFGNFSGINKGNVTSISFVKNKPTDVTDSNLVNTNGKFSYYKKDNDLYVVGRKLIFDFNCCDMFKDFSNVTEINLTDVDTSKVTDMSLMFCDCEKITSLNLSSFNTSNVTNMSNMFGYCSQLTSLNLSNFDTSNVTNMNHMFGGCFLLSSITFGDNFVTQKVTDMDSMFFMCMDLTSLDLSNFDIRSKTNRTSVPTTTNMFDSVPKLIPIYVSNVSDWSSIGGWNFQTK